MSTAGKSERDVAFTAFVESASPSLLRTAWLLTGDHHAAHDLVQAALVRTYVAWPRVRSESALAYARRVLVNERTDRWRRHGAEVAVAALPDRGPRRIRRRDGSDDRDAVVAPARPAPRAAAPRRRPPVLRRPLRAGGRRPAQPVRRHGEVHRVPGPGRAARRAGHHHPRRRRAMTPDLMEERLRSALHDGDVRPGRRVPRPRPLARPRAGAPGRAAPPDGGRGVGRGGDGRRRASSAGPRSAEGPSAPRFPAGHRRPWPPARSLPSCRAAPSSGRRTGTLGPDRQGGGHRRPGRGCRAVRDRRRRADDDDRVGPPADDPSRVDVDLLAAGPRSHRRPRPGGRDPDGPRVGEGLTRVDRWTWRRCREPASRPSRCGTPDVPRSRRSPASTGPTASSSSVATGPTCRRGRDGRSSVFVDEAQDLFGMFDAEGSVATKRLSDTEPGGRPVMMTGVQVEGSRMMATTVLVVLPPGLATSW